MDADDDDQYLRSIPGAFPITPTPDPQTRQDYFAVPPSTTPLHPPTPLPSTSPSSPPPVPTQILKSPPLPLSPSPPPFSYSTSSPPLRRLSPRAFRVELPTIQPYELSPPIPQVPYHPGDTPSLELQDPLGGPAPDLAGGNGEFDFGIAEEMYFDEEGLGTLEKIYLFARSRAIFHRVFISRSLPNFLPDVTPQEAVEYVLPLLNSLGTDPEDSVREAFVSELVPTMWWFFSNCQLIDDGYFALVSSQNSSASAAAGGDASAHLPQPSPESLQQQEQPQSSLHSDGGEPSGLDSGPLQINDGGAHFPPDHLASSITPSLNESTVGGEALDVHDSSDLPDQPEGLTLPSQVVELPEGQAEQLVPPLLPVQCFTPLLASLLLGSNVVVGDAARAAVVELLRRLKDGFDLPLTPEDPHPFGHTERKMLEKELLMGVVIGMARMDYEVPLEGYAGGSREGSGNDSSRAESSQGVSPPAVGLGVVASEIAVGGPSVWPQFGEQAVTPSGLVGQSKIEGVTEPYESVGGNVEEPSTSVSFEPETSSTVELLSAMPPAFPSTVSLPQSSPPASPVSSSSHIQLGDASAAPTIVLPPSPSPVSPSLQSRSQPQSPIRSLPIPLPYTAHLTHLTPTSRSRASSPTPLSPLRSAPHTPPSPTLRPVRLPSTESARSVSIPSTPFEGLPEDVLGLGVEATPLPPPEAFLPIHNLKSGPSTPWAADHTPASPLPLEAPPGSLSERTQQSQDVVASGSSLRPLAEPVLRRPLLSPVQPSDAQISISKRQEDSPSRPTSPEQPTTSRTKSYSSEHSEKSESTPTEGSSNETVTPADSPAVSPTQERGPIVPIAETVPAVAPVPSTMTFQSVPIPPPPQHHGRQHTNSPASTNTSSSSPSVTLSSDHSTPPITGSSGRTLSSAASTTDTPSSSESEVIRTPESAEEAYDSAEPEPGVGAEDIGELADAEQLVNPYFLAAKAEGLLVHPEPFRKASTPASVVSEEGTESETPPTMIEPLPRPEVRKRSALSSPPYLPDAEDCESTVAVSESQQSSMEALAGPRGVESLQISSSGAETVREEKQLGPDHVIALLSPVQLSNSGFEAGRPLVPADASQNAQPDQRRLPPEGPSSTSSSPDATMSSAAPDVTSPSHNLPRRRTRSRTGTRPDNLPMPTPTVVDSPYPSPANQDALRTNPMELASVLLPNLAPALDPASRQGAEELTSTVPEGISHAAAVVRLPASGPSPLDVDPASGLVPVGNGGNGSGSGSGNGTGSGSEISWVQGSGEMTADEGVMEGSEDAAVGRVASMSLIAAVTAAGVLSEETKRVFTSEVVRVAADAIYWVRREAAYALGALAKVIPDDLLLSSILPLYEEMTSDAIWQVRQSALFALPGILARLQPEQRRTLALGQCRSLAHDSARLVRSALLEVMGEVIHCFRDDEGGPPAELVNLFIGKNEHHEDSWTRPREEPTRQWGLRMPFQTERPSAASSSAGSSSPPLRSMFEEYNDPSSAQYQGLFGTQSQEMPVPPFRDPDRVLICAFNFPAVVAAMGAARWAELQPYYRELTKDSSAKVRRTLSASIGEIARIIGPENAHRNLISVWWDMMHDEDSEVRAKMVACVDIFVEALGMEDRRTAGRQLEQAWSSSLTGWREREILAGQLGLLTYLLAPVQQGSSVRNLVWSALTDKVAAVREAAIASCPQYAENLALEPDVYEVAKQDLHSLATSDSFRRRVTFIAVSQALVTAREDVPTFVTAAHEDTYTALARDPVVDVRIGLSRLIGVLCAKYYPTRITRPGWVQSIVRHLSSDSSAEVKSFVAFLTRRPSSLTICTTPPSPTRPSPFATFSRPPTTVTLPTDTIDSSTIVELGVDVIPIEAIEIAAVPSSSSPVECPPPMELQCSVEPEDTPAASTSPFA